MLSSPPRLITVGEIARRTNVDIHRVEYLIRSRGIKPQGRAGNARVFSESDVGLIADELHRIDARLSNGGGPTTPEDHERPLRDPADETKKKPLG